MDIIINIQYNSPLVYSSRVNRLASTKFVQREVVHKISKLTVQITQLFQYFHGTKLTFDVIFVGELVGSGAFGDVGISEVVGEVVGDVETTGGVGFGVKFGEEVGTDPPLQRLIKC